MRGSGRGMVEASCNGLVRRMVSLPRSILGGFSRAVDQGIDLMRIGGRRNQQQLLPHNFPLQQQYPQQQSSLMNNVQEEWAFLACFEQQFGTMHPFFYACRFVDVLKMAQDEHKFVFMYLHSPHHPFTPSFCRETLCSDVVVQYLDANFVCWGAIADRGEGLHMASTLRPASFPFCAVVAPASGDSLAVLQQMEGPVSPEELVGILQRTMEEQGLAFGSGRRKEEEKRRADRRLKEEQDAAYFASLQIDQEKEKLKSLHSKERVGKQEETSKLSNQKLKEYPTKKQDSKVKETKATSARNPQPKANAIGNAQPTQILIRFPNGERKEKSFLCTDKVQVVFTYIDSLGLQGIKRNYKLVSSFPRKIYGADQMGVTLKDAGFHPKATLFLELI